MSESDRQLLWDRAGSQCAVCHADVRPRATAGPAELVGIELEIGDQPEDAAVVAYEHAILLCINDAVYVTQNPEVFPPTKLRELKTTIERIHRNRLELQHSGTTERVRVLCHVAGFIGIRQPFVFMKIVNDSMTMAIVVDDIWFETDPIATVQNLNRPLPTRIAPRQLFETWKPLIDLPLVSNILERGRVKLQSGSIIASVANMGVSPAGAVGGGGTPLAELHVDENLAGSDAPDTWDVFISHASADKAAVGRPLKESLESHGLRVWFDEAVLGIGDSLRRKIDRGLRRSAAGVVILSPSFFDRGWPNYELDGMVTLDQSGLQNILPIWHGVTFEQVRDYSPSLADKLARNTSNTAIEKIAEEIARRVRPELFSESTD
jgi:hypothetical protein